MIAPLRWGSATDPAPGETACGDRVLHRLLEAPHPAAGHWLAVIDGLGHGIQAAQAADAAVMALDDALATAGPAPGLAELLRQLDAALAATRGAAIGLVHLVPGPAGLRWRHAGVGNTRCLCWRAGAVQRLPSSRGIVGDVGRRPAPEAESHGELAPGDVLLLFSDGLDEQLQLRDLPAGWRQDPDLLARHLLVRWREPRDDAAVLVALP